MSFITKNTCLALLAGAAVAFPAAAELSAADAAKLGTTLTPVGAEKAGNAAGTIPAWAIASTAASSTCNQVSYFRWSLQMRPISGFV